MSWQARNTQKKKKKKKHKDTHKRRSVLRLHAHAILVAFIFSLTNVQIAKNTFFDTNSMCLLEISSEIVVTQFAVENQRRLCTRPSTWRTSSHADLLLFCDSSSFLLSSPFTARMRLLPNRPTVTLIVFLPRFVLCLFALVPVSSRTRDFGSNAGSCLPNTTKHAQRSIRTPEE
jgi:hypothetical protein